MPPELDSLGEALGFLLIVVSMVGVLYMCGVGKP